MVATEYQSEALGYWFLRLNGFLTIPNDWCTEHGTPRYIVDLIKRLVRVSVESARIVKKLPPLNESR